MGALEQLVEKRGFKRGETSGRKSTVFELVKDGLLDATNGAKKLGMTLPDFDKEYQAFEATPSS